MKINANVNLTGDLSLEDASNDSVLTIKDDVNGGTLNIESTASDSNNVQAGTINFDPGESTGTQAAASITAQSSGTTATNRGGKITIKTKSDNGNLLNRLFIDKDSLETENLLTANINATTVNLQAGGSTKLSTNTNYITATVPVSLPDGSASAPVLTNAGDENTGIYFGATDTVNVATNGIERLNINNSTITAGRNIDMQSIYQINNLPDPTTNQQAATKLYADTKVIGTTQTFISSGIWTKPAGARKVEVVVLGAGGGGAHGSGGGGGGYASKVFDATTLPATVAVTVGSGGAGALAGTSGQGTFGTRGGSSKFGNFLQAFGGFPGYYTSGGTPSSTTFGAYNQFVSGRGGNGFIKEPENTIAPTIDGYTPSSPYGCRTPTMFNGGYAFFYDGGSAGAAVYTSNLDLCGMSVYGGGGAGGNIYVTTNQGNCSRILSSNITPVPGGSSLYGGGGGGHGGGGLYVTSYSDTTNCIGPTYLSYGATAGGTTNSAVRGNAGGGNGGANVSSGNAPAGENGSYLSGGGGGGGNSSSSSGTTAGSGGNGGVGGGGGGGGISQRSSSAGNGKGGDGGRGEVIVTTYF